MSAAHMQLVEPSEPWMVEASCRSFPIATLDWFSEDKADIEACRQVCDACPVKADCLDYVQAVVDKPGNVYGVFAGYTAKERRKLRTRG